jgi:hypothetical protein
MGLVPEECELHDGEADDLDALPGHEDFGLRIADLAGDGARPPAPREPPFDEGSGHSTHPRCVRDACGLELYLMEHALESSSAA